MLEKCKRLENGYVKKLLKCWISWLDNETRNEWRHNNGCIIQQIMETIG